MVRALRATVLYAGLGLGLLAVADTAAHADESAHCTVRSIEAQPKDGGIDPRIADLTPQLSRPPFHGWKSFQLLRDYQEQLTAGSSASFDLPEGRHGTLTYKEHLQPSGGKHRVRLQLTIERAGEKQLSTVFVLDEGGTILHAGTHIGDGILILGVSCKTSD